MKYLFSMLFCLGLISGCINKNDYIGLIESNSENLLGNVISIKSTTSTINGITQMKDVISSDYSLYNEFNKPIRSNSLSITGDILFINIYTYDIDGNLLEELIYEMDSEPRLISRTVKTFDEFGRLSEERNYNQLLGLGRLEKYNYDENGNKKIRYHYSDGNAITSTTTYEYKKSGDGVFEHYSAIYTDSTRNHYGFNKYNTKGEKTQHVKNIGEELYCTYYEYDNRGNLTLIKSNGRSEYNFKYEYDKIGNWVTLHQYLNGIYDQITERDIIYYTDFYPSETNNQDKSALPNSKITMVKVNGVYEIPCEINGIKLKFILDTGASFISISETEARLLYKQGSLTTLDILNSSNFINANGEISSGTIVNLKTVKIGDRMLKNVEASVVQNLYAPLLMGQSALKKFGKISIDYQMDEIILSN